MTKSWFTYEEQAAYKLKKIAKLHAYYARKPYVRGEDPSRDIDRDIEDRRDAAIDAKRAAYGPQFTKAEMEEKKMAERYGQD